MEYDMIVNFKHGEKITFSDVSDTEYDRVYRELKTKSPKLSLTVREHVPDEFERRFGL